MLASQIRRFNWRRVANMASKFSAKVKDTNQP